MTSQPLERDRERVRKIARLLLEQTRTGKIQWEPSSAFSYIYSTTSSSVTVSCVDGDDNYPYMVTVFNKDGAPVASLEFVGGGEYSDDVEELYRLAGRVHLDVDGTLDALLGELDDKDPF